LQDHTQKPPIVKQATQPAFGEVFGTDLSEACIHPSVVGAQDSQKQRKKPPISEQATQQAAYKSWDDYLRDIDFSRAPFEEVNLVLDKFRETQAFLENPKTTAATAATAYGGAFMAPSPSLQGNPFAALTFSDETATIPANIVPFATPSPSVQSDGFTFPVSGEADEHRAKRLRIFQGYGYGGAAPLGSK
jgi:hypothetical protein